MSSATTPHGYTFAKWLRQTEGSSVTLAIREADEREVVLKVYGGDRERAGRIPQAQREFEALRAVAGAGVPAALDLLVAHNPPVLVIERAPGIALAQWIPADGVRLEDFLSIAVQLTATLMRVHEKRLIHRDVTPDNILVDPQTLQTHLIDFGLAKPMGALSRTEGRSVIPESLGGTLSYMAPEQTGRMNRGCDFRSDLYCVGATFYHMLTGRPPFESDDALELVHAHIARLPQDPSTLRPGLPEPIGRLLLKLLRKDPEERYQSARALHADLKECLAQLTQHGAIDPGFAPGSVEPPDRPRFLARLYGREREVAQLHDLYRRCAEGQPGVLVLRGEAGSGKSTLVGELRPALAAAGGCLAIGSFDPQRARPYSAWIAILEYLAGQLLLERTERLEQWRQRLREGLGNIARALIDLVPDLQFILGEVPPVPALEPRASQARLSLALQRFLASFAAVDHPLVVFLDDVQWSDAGSRLFLEELLPNVPPALLLIVAFNTSEAGAASSDTGFLERHQRAGGRLEQLELSALGGEHVAAMLSDALHQPRDRTESLAELIERKTGNNPLLVRQFVEHVHERGLLRYEADRWTWDLASLAAADIPDGAVALMTAKIARLAGEPRQALALASCIGEEFDVELLYVLGAGDREALERGVHALCDQGLIAPCEAGLRFLHSRIRDAAQELLEDTEYRRVHYEVGMLLLARTPEDKVGEAIFAIVDHLNRGIERVPPQQELQVIQLNLRAGTSALATGAGAAAASYLSVARGLFERSFKEREEALGVELQLRSADAAFQCRNFDAALAFLGELASRPLPWIQTAQAAALRLRIFALTKNPEECVKDILREVRTLGIRWPIRPTRARARLALRRAGWELALRGTRNLLRRQKDDDPRALGPLLLATLGGPLLRHDLYLSVLQTSLVLTSYLRTGYRTSSSFFLAGYAAYRYLLLGGARHTRSVAETALELSRSIPRSIYTPRTEHVVHALIYPWLMQRREALHPLMRIAEAARELGDPEYAYYGRFVHAIYLALGGDPVPVAEQRLRELMDMVRRLSHTFAEPEACHRAYALLSCADVREVETQIAAWPAPATNVPAAMTQYSSTLRAMVLCIYGRHDLVAAETDARGDEIFRSMGGVHLADHVFYRGLAAATQALRDSGPQRRRRRRLVKSCLRRLRAWARDGPDFVHMAWLLQGELEWLSGRAAPARALYEKAATRAQQQGFLHHAGLACESRARMLLELRRETEAATTLAQAEKLYRQWGALAKARALEEMRRQLVG